ncbi:MAG: hypothetical protein QXY39_01860 [Thermofilaceae archaeon]
MLVGYGLTGLYLAGFGNSPQLYAQIISGQIDMAPLEAKCIVEGSEQESDCQITVARADGRVLLYVHGIPKPTADIERFRIRIASGGSTLSYLVGEAERQQVGYRSIASLLKPSIEVALALGIGVKSINPCTDETATPIVKSLWLDCDSDDECYGVHALLEYPDCSCDEMHLEVLGIRASILRLADCTAMISIYAR